MQSDPGFRAAYATLEERMEARAEADGDVYLPNSTPAGPIQYVLVCMEPERVYIHAGTRAGARALGLYRRQEYLEPEELPEPFQRLRPAEVEDCLCIYKSDLLNAPSG